MTSPDSSSRTALLIGATGLIGQAALPMLLAAPEYRRVVVLARRAPSLAGIAGAERAEVVIDNLSAPADVVPAVDDVFCCLGTTLARAGSRAAFDAVDRGLVVSLARAARAQGARHFLVISAAGTSPNALSFYSRVKARMEAEVANLGYPRVSVLRPSLLLGDRDESRPMEALAQRVMPVLNPLLAGPLRRYRAVTAGAVAEAMLVLARRADSGFAVHHVPIDPEETSL